MHAPVDWEMPMEPENMQCKRDGYVRSPWLILLRRDKSNTHSEQGKHLALSALAPKRIRGTGGT